MYDVSDVLESPDVEFTTATAATKCRQNSSQNTGVGSVASLSSNASNSKVPTLTLCWLAPSQLRGCKGSVRAPSRLRGCKNRAHSVSWPQVIKPYQIRV